MVRARAAGVLSERGQLGSTQGTQIEFIGDDAGPFRAPARVMIAGDPHPRLMDINANVMEQVRAAATASAAAA